MTSERNRFQHYLESLPLDRRKPVTELRNVLLHHLPPGFSEVINDSSLAYVVPHTAYPDGYHCNPASPLPFISVISQKNFIAMYHMGLYADIRLLDWFTSEYPVYSKTKLDMGKSCIRFKKVDQIPFNLIERLASKMTPYEWINLYESVVKNRS
ncbi:DUF1801 domain-containing protein [Dyadobacter psychrotolerans]|uniref:DUF1801 domain-containing protein n=1 Tax=Dyadobacter psychrotolerans TaxID=2541721 RepID=A0A4R5DU67_9BACT|nr:DUF1801 domain-containing protein [Dyadobacter psychrotolerans]TDE17999.1 DUF1801 domain-containing protein [Dyadobacter psychrotolerans]